MASGNLGSLSPSATTSTKLYGCSVYNSTSSTINICNRSSSASASVRVAVKSYDQKVTLDGSADQYNLRTGNILSMWSIDLQNSVSEVPYLTGEVVTTKDGFGSAKYFSKDADTATETYLVSVSSVTEITTQPPTGGSWAVGDTVTDTGATVSGTITKVTGATTISVVMTTGTFSNGTTITNGPVSAVIDTVGSPTNLYFIDLQDGDGPQQTPSLTLYQGKSYVFDLSSASLATHPFVLSTTQNGTHNGGVEYTTGVTKVGTPGNAGASLTLVVDSLTAPILYPYCSTHPGMYAIGNLQIQQSLYRTLYFYDVTGSWSALDVITLGVNEVVIENVNIGPFGFVQNYSGNTLDISLAPTSPVSFTPLTTTITGTSGQSTITVGSATGLLVGMEVSGTGVGTGAIITEISGTTVTLSVANSGAVSGTGTFRYRVLDTPQDPTDLNQSYATIQTITTDVTAVATSDYIVYDQVVDPNTTTQVTGTIVGPGQSLVVYSSTANVSFVMMGFTDNTDDFTIDFGALNS